ncbi:MAG: DUF3299 domain-containing protein [Pseudomonadota bacterium]
MKFIYLILAFLCGPLSAAGVTAAEPPRTINWEELMPDGDTEELERQYEAYYASITQKIAGQSSQSLFDAGDAGGYGGIAEGSELDVMPQLGTFNVVKELDGAHIRIPGFVLPFEYSADGKIEEFLLVPYFGACIHTPPPPPNQIVYVVADKPVPLGEQWEPIWATGVLRAKSNINDLGDAAYTLEIKSWETYKE